MVTFGSAPLHARSTLPRPRYTLYSMPSVIARFGAAMLKRTTRQTGETIQSKIEGLQC